jgi:D-glycero-alpha-D-manno-heptose-7-phosphate kinase
MIITKTPLRISFCGGGTDIPEYYRKHGGCVVSTTIDKFIYITGESSFYRETTQLKYSVVERVQSFDEIKHPIFRECLRNYDVRGVELNSTADIPSGTGLGSSSTFTVGLINLIRAKRKLTTDKEILAKEACAMEIDKLGEPVGKQDQYAAAYGGLNFIRFNRDDTVDVEPIDLSLQERDDLCSRLMMFYLGGTRSASKILEGEGYKTDTISSEEKKKQLCALTEKLRGELNNGKIDSLGKILDDGWKIKRSLANGISNPEIDAVYEKAVGAGAVGGKLLGAGGNGFMLFYVERSEHEAVRKALANYREMKISFDSGGSQVVYNDEI